MWSLAAPASCCVSDGESSGWPAAGWLATTETETTTMTTTTTRGGMERVCSKAALTRLRRWTTDSRPNKQMWTQRPNAQPSFLVGLWLPLPPASAFRLPSVGPSVCPVSTSSLQPPASSLQLSWQAVSPSASVPHALKSLSSHSNFILFN